MFSEVRSFVVRSLIRAADGRLLTGTRRTHTVIVAVPSRNGKRYEGTRSIAVSLGIGSEEIAQRIYRHLTGRDAP